MNFLPARWRDGAIEVAGHRLPVTLALAEQLSAAGEFALGIRPEYVTLSEPGATGALPVTVSQIQDIGTYWLLAARVGETVMRARLNLTSAIPQVGDQVWLKVLGPHSCFYGGDQQMIAAGAEPVAAGASA